MTRKTIDEGRLDSDELIRLRERTYYIALEIAKMTGEPWNVHSTQRIVEDTILGKTIPMSAGVAVASTYPIPGSAGDVQK